MPESEMDNKRADYSGKHEWCIEYLLINQCI